MNNTDQVFKEGCVQETRTTLVN